MTKPFGENLQLSQHEEETKTRLRLIGAFVCGVLSLFAFCSGGVELINHQVIPGWVKNLSGILFMLAAITWWRGRRTMLAWFFMILAFLLWDSIRR